MYVVEVDSSMLLKLLFVFIIQLFIVFTRIHYSVAKMFNKMFATSVSLVLVVIFLFMLHVAVCGVV